MHFIFQYVLAWRCWGWVLPLIYILMLSLFHVKNFIKQLRFFLILILLRSMPYVTNNILILTAIFPLCLRVVLDMLPSVQLPVWIIIHQFRLSLLSDHTLQLNLIYLILRHFSLMEELFILLVLLPRSASWRPITRQSVLLLVVEISREVLAAQLLLLDAEST